MNVFEAARSVSAVDAAERLGLRVKRRAGRGVTRCVFHDDRTPSMQLYPNGYHCFGCGAHGDAIDLYAHMRHLGLLDAARQLCGEFGLAWEEHPSARKPLAQARQPDARVLRMKLVGFRERRAGQLVEKRARAEAAMARREEALREQSLPFEEWWDDPEWARAQDEHTGAVEALLQLDAMDMTQLWQLYQNEHQKEEHHGKPKPRMGRAE